MASGCASTSSTRPGTATWSTTRGAGTRSSVMCVPGRARTSWRPRTDVARPHAQIKDQHSQYLRKELTAQRDKFIPDTRVHCCLFFINPTGHSLKPVCGAHVGSTATRADTIPSSSTSRSSASSRTSSTSSPSSPSRTRSRSTSARRSRRGYIWLRIPAQTALTHKDPPTDPCRAAPPPDPAVPVRHGRVGPGRDRAQRAHPGACRHLALFSRSLRADARPPRSVSCRA